MEENRKYRYTKQLINIALRDGWTQKQIADACRTQQSIVSSWKNGTALAKESQLTKLLEQYGPKLFRKTFKIYHKLEASSEKELKPHMIKVEGNLILSFPYRNVIFCPQCRKTATIEKSCDLSHKNKKTYHTRKINIHDMGKGEFCLVHQQRFIKDEGQGEYQEINLFSSSIVGRFEINDLLNKIHSMQFDELYKYEIDGVEHLMLQIITRKALLEHGYPIEGVEEHRSSW